MKNEKIVKDFLTGNLKNIIKKDYPNLNIKSVKTIDNGWDNFVIEVNSKYIFRFPKRDELTRFKTEINVLNYLQGKTMLQIPKIDYIGKTYRYTGYKKIKGVTLTKEILGSLTKTQQKKLIFDIANFLYEIHKSITQKKAKELKVDTENMLQYIDNVNSKMKNYKNTKIKKFIKQTLDEYVKMQKQESEIGFIYADLHEDNMAFDNNTKKLIGVYDFGDITIGEINREFNYLYRFDKKLFEDVADEYQKLSKRKINRRRSVIYSRVNEFTDFATYINKPKLIVYKNTIRNFKKWIKEINIYK